MGINGYELQGIAFVRSGGPMWRTVTSRGDNALLTLHTQGDAERYVERWKRWATITSPHVAALYDVIAHDDGRWALVQAEVPGDSLALLLESRDDVLKVHGQRIAQGIRAGIEALHSAGVVHGDIAPKNIIITPDGLPVIIDLIGWDDEHAGTPGWSDTFGVDQQPSMEADVRAFERIRTALTTVVAASPTPVASDPSNPGVRLRAHGELPATERRPSRFPSWAQIAGRSHPGESTHDTPSHPSMPQRRSLLARRILAIGIIIAAIIGGWGSLRVFAQPEPVSTHTPHDTAASIGATSTHKTHPECPAPEAVIGRLEEILRARDTAYNTGDASGLDALMEGQWLRADQHNIATMARNNTRVSGFTTTVDTPSIDRCTKDDIRIKALLSAAAYTVCTPSGCTDAPGTPEHPRQVLITLRRSDLVLTSVDEAAPAS